jgi:hypothetical protein
MSGADANEVDALLVVLLRLFGDEILVGDASVGSAVADENQAIEALGVEVLVR